MHEMSIANSLLEALEKESPRFPRGRITKAGLRIGELSGVNRDSLTFCWEAVVRGTDWESLDLEIEYSPLRHRCRDCGKEFAVDGFEAACPYCGGSRTVFAGGDELDLVFLEVEENEPARGGTESTERK